VRLPLRSGRIDFLFYGQVDDDLVLVYEVSDGETTGGTIVRLLPLSLRAKWRLNLPSFNLSVGTFEGSRLYQAAFGFVAAVDLDRGTYVWSHQGLYDPRRYSFNAFERPEVNTTDVVFRERLSSAGKGPPRIIRVAKNSGKIQLECEQPGR
jgi:hypothetical protein